ncbi:MAG: hypothetical protein ACRCXE_01445 [Metamycoplasmataceae bacterium]
MENIKGIKAITIAWKNYEIEVRQRSLVNGKISGTFVGRLRIMSITKKITMNDLFKKIESMDKKFESIDKKIESLDKKFEKKFEAMGKKIEAMDKKIDLMLSTPTMQKEIDHDALSKLNQLS